MVEAPFSPRWVSEEWRSWWSVQPPVDCLNRVEAAFVGESSPAGVWAFVSPGWDDVGLPVG